LSLAGKESAGTFFGPAARVARRIMAPSREVQPLRCEKLTAAELQVCGLRIPRGSKPDVRLWFQPFKPFNRWRSVQGENERFQPFLMIESVGSSKRRSYLLYKLRIQQ
jgi:hypothetical protein